MFYDYEILLLDGRMKHCSRIQSKFIGSSGRNSSRAFRYRCFLFTLFFTFCSLLACILLLLFDWSLDWTCDVIFIFIKFPLYIWIMMDVSFFIRFRFLTSTSSAFLINFTHRQITHNLVGL